MTRLTHDQMAAILNSGASVVYRQQIFYGPSDVSNLPSDAEMDSDDAMDTAGSFITLEETVEPPAPPGGYSYLYINSSSHHLCRKDSDGAVSDLG